jgi:hypothetical protein
MNPMSPGGITGQYTFDVSLAPNVDHVVRTKNITLSGPNVPDQTIAITQGVHQTWAYFDTDAGRGRLKFSPPLTDQVVNVGFKIYAFTRGEESGLGHHEPDTYTRIYRDGVMTNEAHAEIYINGNYDEDTVSYSTTMNSITSALLDKILIRVTGSPDITGPDCYYHNSGDYFEGLGYVQIENVTKVSGLGAVDVSTNNKYWYKKRVHTACIPVYGESSTLPVIGPKP